MTTARESLLEAFAGLGANAEQAEMVVELALERHAEELAEQERHGAEADQ